ncbi:hypothetical protein [Rhodococcoides kyotonense]|uniref:Uncharacterized protein n=1 Tax=Rhodococcoides kyotonense TaxID=398843 RepID=A0A239FMT3_9NOCA|nr:hypothetical protein [Rhodococcus kyotonensis]SNS58189.1 hypothetical protein SAMN05421642_103376 [Rhodococcus kyotonensis]
MADTGVYVLAAQLLDRLTEELHGTRAGEVSWSAVFPGTQIQPHFGDCTSVAGVRIKTITPTISFPQPARQINEHTAHEYMVVFEMIVDRCAYTPADNSVPDIPFLDSMVRDAMDDAAAMRKAALCTWTDRDVVLGMWIPRYGGGANGGAMDVTVAADVHCGCDVIPTPLDELVQPLEGDPRFY